MLILSYFYFHIASNNILFMQLAYTYQCFLLFNHMPTSLPSQPKKEEVMMAPRSDNIYEIHVTVRGKGLHYE